MKPPEKTSTSIDSSQQFSDAIEDGLHSLKLEGISVSDATLKDLKLFDEGSISEEEFLNRVLARATSKDA